MGSISVRGSKLYAWIKAVDGAWKRIATGQPDTPEGRTAAEELIADLERKVEAERAALARVGASATSPMTVRRWADRWIDDRRKLDLDWKNDRNRLEHVLPAIGELLVADVRTRHIVDVFAKIRTTPSKETGKPLAPRTVHNIYSVVSAMFRDARLANLIEQSPCCLTDRQLGPLRDKDPLWRQGAVYTRDEAQIMISDSRIAADRRLTYGFGLLAGLRPGEIAALRWTHYDSTVQPLGKLTIAFAHNTRKNRTKGTKTEAVRNVPVHPTLAAMLAEWKLSGWAAMMGRPPAPDDLILPLPPDAAAIRRTRDGEPIRTGDYMGKAWRERDLKMLGWRARELYATKSTFITLAIDDGARPEIIRDRITHAKIRRDAFSGYDRGPHWIETCREIAKLELVRTRDAHDNVIVLPLAAMAGGGASGGDPRTGRNELRPTFVQSTKSGAKSDRKIVEAAGVELSQDVNETERLLHDQELGVLGDPTSSVVILCPRAERGQSESSEALPTTEHRLPRSVDRPVDDRDAVRHRAQARDIRGNPRAAEHLHRSVTALREQGCAPETRR